MKMTGSQRSLYLLALILLLIAVALACIWTFGGGGQTASQIKATPSPQPTASATPGTEVAVNAPAGEAQQTMSTVVYYQDNYGYLVPVMCNVAYQDGIAKATLKMMVQSPENDMNAARLGLRTVLPENTTFDLDISEGLARIDLSKEVLGLADAAAESNMVTAIVQTLTEFDSVDRVEFLIDGQKREKLTHGTDVSGTFERGDINLETAVSASRDESLQAVQLYFPCESGNVVVPVTRMVYPRADLNTALTELAKGPSTSSPLENTLPSGCGLISVELADGVARVNFTREFADMVENTDGGRLALKALVLTCTQFEGVEEVEVFVEGEPYDAGAGTLDVPTFANMEDEIVSSYIQAQSSLIFDFE